MLMGWGSSEPPALGRDWGEGGGAVQWSDLGMVSGWRLILDQKYPRIGVDTPWPSHQDVVTQTGGNFGRG